MAKLLSSRSVRLRGYRQAIWPLVDTTNPINRGLTGYWPCDGQGLAVTPDGSGFGNDGVMTAVSYRDSHHGGNALSFNGSTSNVIIPSNAAITGAALRSFSLWINTATTSGSYRLIFSYGDAASVQNLFGLGINGVTGGDLYFASNNGDWRTPGTVLTVNTWYHVVIVYTGGTLSTAGSILIYLNGISQSLTAAGSGANALSTPATAIHIGDDLTTAGRVFSGGIEAFRQYTRVLTQAEISQLYAEPYAGILEAPFSRVGAAAVTPSVGMTLPMMGVG